MGVPSLYNYLTTTYKITTTVQQTDFLYLDFNAIVHNSIRITEDTLFKNIGDYLDLLIEKVNPKYVYISVDGRAPVSKVYQQRCRRHLKGGKHGNEEWRYVKISKDKSKDEKKYKNNEKVENDRNTNDKDDIDHTHNYNPDSYTPNNKSTFDSMYEESSSDVEKVYEFDNNSITPGTPFMDRLNTFMDNHIRDGLNTQKYTQLIIYSSSLVKGEGEQKILKHLNTHTLTSSIYSPDADLLFLTLQTKNTYIIREPHGKCTKCQKQHKFFACDNVKRTELISVDVNELKKRLVEDTTKYINFGFSAERILADICFVNFLCGNDFVPRLLCFDVRFDGVGLLLSKLGKYYRCTGQYILKKRGNNTNLKYNYANEKRIRQSNIHANEKSKEMYDPAFIRRKCINDGTGLEHPKSINKGYKPFSIEKGRTASKTEKEHSKSYITYKDQIRKEHLFESKENDEYEPYYIDYGLLKGFLEFIEKDEDYLYLRKVGLLKSMRKRYNLKDEEEIDLTKQEGKNKYYKEKLFRVIDENDSIIKKKHKSDETRELKGCASDNAKSEIISDTSHQIDDTNSMPGIMHDDKIHGSSMVSDNSYASNNSYDNDLHDTKSEMIDNSRVSNDTKSELNDSLYKKNDFDLPLPFARKNLPLFDNDYTELRMKAGYEYMKALTWLTSLYLNNHVASWSWYYPYHYPPLISDLLLNKDTAFDFYDNYDLSLLQQAVAVMPSSSKQNLPFVFHDLLKEYRIEIDMFDKLLDWQGVPLIPFCNLEDLHKDYLATNDAFYKRCFKTDLSKDDNNTENGKDTYNGSTTSSNSNNSNNSSNETNFGNNTNDEKIKVSLPIEYTDASTDNESVEHRNEDGCVYANDNKEYYFDSLEDMKNFYIDICYRNTPGDDILYVHKTHPSFKKIEKVLSGGPVDIGIGLVEPYCYGRIVGEESDTMTVVFGNKKRLNND